MSDFWVQTLSGKRFDLIEPDPRTVEIEDDIAPALGKIARFAGHTRGLGAYSIAQHCVLGADSLFAKTSSPRLAALFLLHDAHEVYIGDIPTPVAAAMEAVVSRMTQVTGLVKGTIERMKYNIDAAIFKAAGVDLPTEVERAAIHEHDIAMANAERRVLLVDVPIPWGGDHDKVPPAELADDELEPWSATEARFGWLGAFDDYIVNPEHLLASIKAGQQ